VIAVIFEVVPREGKMDRYLKVATLLRPMLEEVDGFISVERFQSLTEPGKILSLSFFRDEKAVEAWRALEAHREAQSKGRNSLFSNYRLRVAEVKRDYGLLARDQAPSDSRAIHGA